MTEVIKRLSEVKSITGLSRSTIYRMASEGVFPRPIKLGIRASGWLGSEVQNWIDGRLNIAREQDNNASDANNSSNFIKEAINEA